MSDITVVEHMDPTEESPSGIDTVVRDLVKFAPSAYQFKIVGVTQRMDIPLGKWVSAELGGREIGFMPVSRFDRRASGRQLNRIPHSMRFAVGLTRNASVVKGKSVHAHRLETGLICGALGAQAVTQFLHNNQAGILGDGSDSLWSRVPWAYQRLEVMGLRRASAAAVFNKSDGHRLRKLRQDVVTAETWFDPKVFYPAEAIRPASRLSVVWVGRLEAQKDPLLALAVATCLRDSGASFTMDIFGDGSLFESMHERIVSQDLAAHVHLHGAAPRTEVASALRSANAALMTSVYEGSPTVLIEALACGTPVIATSVTDQDGLLDGRNGIAPGTRDPAVLARCLEHVGDFDRTYCATSVHHRAAPKAVPTLLALASPRLD